MFLAITYALVAAVSAQGNIENQAKKVSQRKNIKNDIKINQLLKACKLSFLLTTGMALF